MQLTGSLLVCGGRALGGVGSIGGHERIEWTECVVHVWMYIYFRMVECLAGKVVVGAFCPAGPGWAVRVWKGTPGVLEVWWGRQGLQPDCVYVSIFVCLCLGGRVSVHLRLACVCNFVPLMQLILKAADVMPAC